MRIKIPKPKRPEALMFDNVMIKTINIEADPTALKDGVESFTIKVAYQTYAVNVGGAIIFEGRAKRLEFKDVLAARAGFMKTLNRAIAKKIKDMHNLDIEVK